MVHRAIFGSFERFLGILTEHFAGVFPLWLAPVQVKLMSIVEKHNEYANKVRDMLEEQGIRVELDDRNEKIGYKIREAQLQKVPYMLILGDKEVEENKVGVRERKAGDLGQMSIDDFMSRIKDEIESKKI